jgi:beta-glucosidase
VSLPPYVEVAPIPGASYTEMGWEVYPDGLAAVLQRLHRDYTLAALLITENGAAFQDHWDGNNHVNDPRRVQYLREHIQAVGHARHFGVPMHGYFAWSLFDNYEWTEGYSKRFGMVYVDYPTQRRIIKNSGHWYRDFIAAQRRES